MAQLWWVNHNRTARQEIDGQHLWSPKTESNGARREFYNNMRRATPGDLVLYAHQAIRYVGGIAEFAFTVLKPMEFGETGVNWNQEGMASADLLDTTLPFDPSQNDNMESRPAPAERYSPFHPVSGSGNQKAYLTGIPRDTFDLVIAGATISHEAVKRRLGLPDLWSD